MNNQFLKLAIVSLVSLSLTACFNDDDDETPPANSAPTAMSVDLITQADTPIVDSVTATDVDMDVLTFSIDTPPSNGTLTLDANGQFTYQPAPTVTGTDSFVFSVTDGLSASVNGTVNITIEALQVNFSAYSRAAFVQSETDMPLPLNGREFTQDVTDINAFDDLLDGQ